MALLACAPTTLLVAEVDARRTPSELERRAELEKVSDVLVQARRLQLEGFDGELTDALPVLELDGERVRVEIRLTELTPAVLEWILGTGMDVLHVSYPAARVAGSVKLDALAELAAIPQVAVVHPLYETLSASRVLGPEATRAAVAPWLAARDPRGIGILANGFSGEAGDIDGVACGRTFSGSGAQQSGALPPTVTLLGSSGAGSEAGADLTGILYGADPASDYLVYSADLGAAHAAAGLGVLGECGADVLVNDLIHPAEPMFRPGVVETEIRSSAAGESYFGLRQAVPFLGVDTHYKPRRQDQEMGRPEGAGPRFRGLHDFGGDPFVPVELPAGCSASFVLQWDEAFDGALGAGSVSDLDLYLCDDADLGSCAAVSRSAQGCSREAGVGGDPLEVVKAVNQGPDPDHLFLAVDRVCGAEQPRFRLAAVASDCGPLAAGGSMQPLNAWAPVPLGTINVTAPAANVRVPEGRDYATYELGNPWDMSCPDWSGVALEPGDPIWDERFTCDLDLPASREITGESFAGGVYQATAQFNDARFWPVFQGSPGSVPLERGILFPIDTATYRYFSAKIRVLPSGASEAHGLQLFYYRDNTFELGTFGSTLATAIQENVWTVIKVDLETQAFPGLQWRDQSQIVGLRVDPTSLAGHTFEVDWMRLTSDPASAGAPASQTTVSWNATGTGSNPFTIEAIDAMGVAYTLASGLPAGTTTHQADFSVLPPGSYSVRVSTNSDSGTSPGNVLINQAPIVHITDPDKLGDLGDDYATVQLANPWGPMDLGDIIPPGGTETNLQNLQFLGGVLFANAPPIDPTMTLNTPVPIDTSRYRMLTFDYKLAGITDVVRLLWGPDPIPALTSDDVVIQQGRNTYALGDMKKVPLEGGATDQWNGNLNTLRFDPHEASDTRAIEFYSLRLAALDLAKPIFEIKWDDVDPDDNATIKLFYDPDRNPANGNEVLIASGLKENSATDSFSWNASLVTPGVYNILANVTDGRNTVNRYSTGPISVETPPVLGPFMEITPASLDFGRVETGMSKSLGLTLENTGFGGPDLEITSMSLSSGGGPYSLDTGGGADPCGGTTPTLPPGDSCTVVVDFDPTTAAPFERNLTVQSNSATDPTQVVPISGLGAADLDCGTSSNVVLPPTVVTANVVKEACLTLTAGPYTVNAGVFAVLRAGVSVILKNGVTINGRLRIDNDASLTP